MNGVELLAGIPDNAALHGAITAIELTVGMLALIACMGEKIGWMLWFRFPGALGCLAVGVWYLATWP